MNELLWNSVVLAYESHFEFLEDARQQYLNALSKLKAELENFHAVAANLMLLPQELILGNVQLKKPEKFEEFILGSLIWEVKAEDLVWATIIARPGGQFSGTPGTLQLGVRAEDYPWQQERFMTLASRNLGWQIEYENPIIEKDWVHSEQVHLDQNDAVDEAVKRLIDLTKGTGTVVAEILKMERPILNFFAALNLLESELTNIPDFAERNAIPYRGKEKWPSEFMQQDLDGISIWIAVARKPQNLMCYFDKESSGIAQKFACSMQCEYGFDEDCPAITLMKREQLQKASLNEIVNCCMTAFRKFIEFVPRKTN